MLLPISFNVSSFATIADSGLAQAVASSIVDESALVPQSHVTFSLLSHGLAAASVAPTVVQAAALDAWKQAAALDPSDNEWPTKVALAEAGKDPFAD